MKRMLSVWLVIMVCAAALIGCSTTGKKGKGADSLEKLIGITMDFLNSDGDYSILESVTDTRICLAYFLKEGIYEMDGAFTWDDAAKKADLILLGAETLQREDPELAQTILDGMLRTGENVKNLEDAIDKLIKQARCDRDDTYYSKYKGLKGEFDPENITAGEDNYGRYFMGQVRDSDDLYNLGLDLIYYERDGAYFFVSFEETLG